MKYFIVKQTGEGIAVYKLFCNGSTTIEHLPKTTFKHLI